jgi:hypothetical protein
VCAQRRVDPRNTYNRVIAVVSFTGKGVPSDPKWPQYAPWPPSQDPIGILAFAYLPSDDGRFALVEFVARNRSAFQALFNDNPITVFEKGRVGKAGTESALKPFRKDFNLNTFGMVMP